MAKSKISDIAGGDHKPAWGSAWFVKHTGTGTMKRIISLTAVLAAFVFLALQPAAVAAKQKGDFLVRVRAVAFIPDEDGTSNVGGSANVDNDFIPELDFTYFFTKNIAAELILATTRHSVTVDGVAHLGSVRLLPPVLSLQYHFRPDKKISPYIGAGLNYTITYAEDTSSSITQIDYSNEFGYSFQAGVDYKLNDRYSLNFDIKKVYVETDISVNNGSITAVNVDLDPWVISFGVGYTF